MDAFLSTRQMAWVLGRSSGTIREMTRGGELEPLSDEVTSTNEQRI